MNSSPTIQDVLDALQHFSSHVDEQFVEIRSDTAVLQKSVVDLKEDAVGIKRDIIELKQDVVEIKRDVVTIKKDVACLTNEVTGIRNTTITKDTLTECITDLRGDLIVTVRKEDRKFGTLVDELLQRKVLDQAAATRILGMEPFAQVNS